MDERSLTTMRLLRDATRAGHDAAERTDLSRAMLGGTISLEQYASQLAAYERIHAALEDAVAAAPPVVREVVTNDMAKTPRLRADLRAMRAVPILWSASEGPGVCAYRAELGRASADVPTLLGHVYVLEGSTLGGLFLLPRLTRALQLTSENSNFYRASGEQTMAIWRDFGARIDATLVASDQRARAVDAARRAFALIARVFDDIWSGPHFDVPS